KRGKNELEFEILDTGIFDNNEYFDVYTEYAKGSEDDILIKISAVNRSKKTAPLYVLPTLWIRNFWSFMDMEEKPSITKKQGKDGPFVFLHHPYVGDYNLYFDKADKLLFTENETNMKRIYKSPNDHPYKKDIFHDAVLGNDYSLATKKSEGTKFSPLYSANVASGETYTLKLRFTKDSLDAPFDDNYEAIFQKRRLESEAFFENLTSAKDENLKSIQKQALAGLLWTKQYYNYDVE